jgi:acyl-CoA thioesterase-1
MTHAITRQTLLVGLGAAYLGSFSMTGRAFAAAPDGTKVVTMLGDSITAGYGLQAAAALPAQLQVELTHLRLKVRVRPSGVSGDTSADGLARVGFSVKDDTDLCIVALGANDLLQGIDPKITRANLDAILVKLQARRIPALLVGLKAPNAIGASYARDFDAVFPTLAKAHHIPLYPDLLAGVMLDPALNQGDGVHPNARGVGIIAQRMAPSVAAALTTKR